MREFFGGHNECQELCLSNVENLFYTHYFHEWNKKKPPSTKISAAEGAHLHENPESMFYQNFCFALFLTKHNLTKDALTMKNFKMCTSKSPNYKTALN